MPIRVTGTRTHKPRATTGLLPAAQQPPAAHLQRAFLRMEKYLVTDVCPSAAAVASSRSQTAQGEPLCPHSSSRPGSWLAAEKGWSRRKGTASCSNTKAGKTGSLAFSACRAGWRPSPHKGSIRRMPAPRRLAVLEPSKAADCGGNARSNPSGKAAVSVGVQAPTWTFFKGSQL